MAKKRIQLTFPPHLIKEPVIYNMAIKCEVIPNVRRAKVNEEVGEMVLELDGTEEALELGVQYLSDQGVQVDPVEGDIVSG